MADKTRQRLLEFAVQRLGPLDLAARLKVDEATLRTWIEHRTPMPFRAQLALADLISDLEKSPARRR